MYERSAIVLEKCFNDLIGLNEEPNIKIIFNYYRELVTKTEEYQVVIEKENQVISEFDQIASEIKGLQQEQKKLYKSNLKLEDDRNNLFEELQEEPDKLEVRLFKIETGLNENNEKIKELSKDFVTTIGNFSEKQEERNECSKNRRIKEKEYLELIDKINNCLTQLDKSKLVEIKEFVTEKNEENIKNIVKKMIDNGKGEKIPFYEDAIEKSVNAKYELNQKLAGCYANGYDKTKRLLSEISKDSVNIEKHKKAKNDLEIKVNFLMAQNNYIIDFLDYERMTAINGEESHKELMKLACTEFDLDMKQFNNLYQLILKEISGKATKKAYSNLYDKKYLKNVIEKQKKVDNEINSASFNTSTLINSSIWRTQEIKDIYEVFLNQISEKLGKDMTEFQLEESEEENVSTEQDEIFKTEMPKEESEKVEKKHFNFEDDDEYFDFGDDEEDDYDNFDDDANNDNSTDYNDEDAYDSSDNNVDEYNNDDSNRSDNDENFNVEEDIYGNDEKKPIEKKLKDFDDEKVNEEFDNLDDDFDDEDFIYEEDEDFDDDLDDDIDDDFDYENNDNDEDFDDSKDDLGNENDLDKKSKRSNDKKNDKRSKDKNKQSKENKDKKKDSKDKKSKKDENDNSKSRRGLFNFF